jgi:hypothetical protein
MRHQQPAANRMSILDGVLEIGGVSGLHATAENAMIPFPESAEALASDCADNATRPDSSRARLLDHVCQPRLAHGRNCVAVAASSVTNVAPAKVAYGEDHSRPDGRRGSHSSRISRHPIEWVTRSPPAASRTPSPPPPPRMVVYGEGHSRSAQRRCHQRLPHHQPRRLRHLVPKRRS